MIIADRAKSFGRRLHCVATHRAVDVKINEAGRKIIAFKIDNRLANRRSLRANRRDHPVFSNQVQSVANAIRENQPPVLEDH